MTRKSKQVKFLHYNQSDITKIVVAGNGGIGKTTCITRFIDEIYDPQTMTIGVEFASKKYTINQTEKRLVIWDLSGQNQFKFLLEDLVKSADGLLLCFDLTRYKSFKDLKEWNSIFRERFPRKPAFLIGLKSDLRVHPSITKKKVSELMEDLEILDYFEISAKENDNIFIPFERITKKIEKSEIEFLKH